MSRRVIFLVSADHTLAYTKALVLGEWPTVTKDSRTALEELR